VSGYGCKVNAHYQDKQVERIHVSLSERELLARTIGCCVITLASHVPLPFSIIPATIDFHLLLSGS